MKATIHIETYTMAAYRAIRPAVVAARVGYIGVCGLTISASIFMKDYAYLCDVVNIAARSAGIPHSEYSIVTLQTISTSRPPL